MSAPEARVVHGGLEGAGLTHDTTERLSWYLFAPVSTKRPGYERGQDAMKALCGKCHARPSIDEFYKKAEAVIEATNQKVKAATGLVDQLRAEGLIAKQPFTQPIQFTEFDLWHYYGRTAKHGAFIGGADFVQWHGNYPMLARSVELRTQAEDLRRRHGH